MSTPDEGVVVVVDAPASAGTGPAEPSDPEE
jgi:hypothetical protein